MASVTLVADAHGCRLGSFGDMFITIFEGPGSLEQLKLLELHQDPFVSARGKVVSITIIASPRLESPTPEFRAASTKLQEKYQNKLVCSAIIITTKGLAAVVARSFLAAYQLLVQYKSPHQTFREVGPAVDWIKKVAPTTPGLGEATKAIEDFLARK